MFSSLAGSGSYPGILDNSQRARLLRHPDSTLLFAAFDPLTASGQKDVPDLRKLSLNEELYRPKRVVVESTPTGEKFWRFVPRARLEKGLADEGTWPRTIEICGQIIECSQDQWDIYKLDPEYECFVQAPPKLSTIKRVTSKSTDYQPQSSHCNKRPLVTPSPERNMPQLSTREHFQQQSYSRGGDISGSSSSEEDEVEEMIIDGDNGLRERRKTLREEVGKNRRLRREKIARAEAKHSQHGNAIKEDASMLDLTQPGPSTPTEGMRIVPPDSPRKRKASSPFYPFRTQVGDSPQTADGDDTNGQQHKRNRQTVSPKSARRDIMEKRAERERRKKERRDCMLDEWRQEKHKRFMSEVLAEVPRFTTPIDNAQEEDPNCKSENGFVDLDEAAMRQAAIEESRRKLAELEADRPLWEEQAKKREMLERDEEEVRRSKREQKLREASQRAEEEWQAKLEAEECEARLRDEETRRQKEARIRRALEKRQREQRWSTGPWTTQRALERYKILCENFDGTKFSLDEPLTFDDVPWPVLQSPMSFTVEDVDWNAVEQFFEAVRPHMRTQDYKIFVERSQRRFHPDRWRSRGLLKSLTDESERGYLEVAANTVAQALTPLWREIRNI